MQFWKPGKEDNLVGELSEVGLTLETMKCIVQEREREAVYFTIVQLREAGI